MPLYKRYSKDKRTYTYYMKYRNSAGRTVRVSTNTRNRKVAERIYKKALENVALKKAGVVTEQNKTERISLKDFKDIYIDYLRANRRSAGTIDLYGYAISNFLLMFPDKMLDEIAIREIEAWKARGLEELTPTSVNVYQRSLQSAFNVSVKLGYLLKNPFADVELIAPSYDDDIVKIYSPYIDH